MLYSDRTTQRQKRGSHASAFVIEAVLLILFLVTSLAIVMSMLSISYRQETEAVLKTRAMTYAIECAESFVVDPEGLGNSFTKSEDGMVIKCDVTPFETTAGVLCYAHITVFPTDAVVVPVHPLANISLPSSADGAQADPQEIIVFELDTARYVSKAGV